MCNKNGNIFIYVSDFLNLYANNQIIQQHTTNISFVKMVNGKI